MIAKRPLFFAHHGQTVIVRVAIRSVLRQRHKRLVRLVLHLLLLRLLHLLLLQLLLLLLQRVQRRQQLRRFLRRRRNANDAHAVVAHVGEHCGRRARLRGKVCAQRGQRLGGPGVAASAADIVIVERHFFFAQGDGLK